MQTPVCPRCKKEPARVHPVYGILLGWKCKEEDATKRKPAKSAEFVTQTQSDRVNEQRDAYEKDMIPAYTHEGKPSEEFRRAFPEKAKDIFSNYTEITGQETELSN